MLTKNFIMKCKIGLHARPASILVTEAEKFKSDITIKYKKKEVPLKSIIGVMTLGIETGEELEIAVNGEDEEIAMNRMEKFFEEEIIDL